MAHIEIEPDAPRKGFKGAGGLKPKTAVLRVG